MAGDLAAPALAVIRDALRQVLTAHEPNPAVVIDRHWNLVDANTSVDVYTRMSRIQVVMSRIQVVMSHIRVVMSDARVVTLGILRTGW